MRKLSLINISTKPYRKQDDEFILLLNTQLRQSKDLLNFNNEKLNSFKRTKQYLPHKSNYYTDNRKFFKLGKQWNILHTVHFPLKTCKAINIHLAPVCFHLLGLIKLMPLY